MAISFCSLSSSSVHGNSYLVRGGDGTVLMVDCGIRLRRLESLLTDVGVAPGAIGGLFMSHDHTDHTIALRLRKPFAARHGIPVYAEPAFWRGWDATHPGDLPAGLRRSIRHGETVRIGGLTVKAIHKPHDTDCSIGFHISDGHESVAVITDLGHVPPGLADELRGVDYLIFESNHDVRMEQRSGRPWPLIQRVLGDRGHLSNEQSRAALLDIAGPLTRVILLAHLSLDCNRPDLAHSVICDGLTRAGHKCQIEVAHPDRPSGWLPGARVG